MTNKDKNCTLAALEAKLAANPPFEAIVLTRQQLVWILEAAASNQINDVVDLVAPASKQKEVAWAVGDDLCIVDGPYSTEKEAQQNVRNPSLRPIPLCRCESNSKAVAAWEPQFDAIVHEQERLAVKFCEEIAGQKGGKPSLPDPVRLLEMAEALYLAERTTARGDATSAPTSAAVREPVGYTHPERLRKVASGKVETIWPESLKESGDVALYIHPAP